MPKSRAELAIQNEAVRILTTIKERSIKQNKTPKEILQADQILLGQAMMLSSLCLNTENMKLNISDSLIDMLI